MPETPLPLILEPEQLEAELGRENLVILHISKPQRYQEFHVPGALLVEGHRFVRAQKPVFGLLPEADDFARLLESLGVGPDSHVVCYDDEGGGWASRLLWTLEVAGHRNYSLLNGGLVAWVNEGFPCSREAVSATGDSVYDVRWREEPVATTDYILSRLGEADLGLLDSRTPEEFSGAKRFSSRGGHIPGAANLNWLDTMDRSRNLRFKPQDELRDMLQQRGLDEEREIVCYCQSHHRSSHACIMLESLGYPRVKGYPGSWSEWGNRSDTPVE
ncbi:MAG TPA: sulfurtransferase [Gammaproteobacteria bacterium]|nr:sulfurtransferase [Gammaproteobacteria bacterium]